MVIDSTVDNSEDIVHFVLIPRPTLAMIAAKRTTRHTNDQLLTAQHYFSEAWKILSPLYFAKSLNQLPQHAASFPTGRVLECKRGP